MEREFSFKIPKKEFSSILLKRRGWYILTMIAVLLLLGADGVVLGLTAYDGIQWWLVALIPVLASVNGIVWFFGFTDGGVQIFGDCKAVFDGQGTLTVSCKHKSSFFMKGKTGFEKTMKIDSVVKDGNYWIIHGDHRQWAAIPTEVSIPLELLPEAKK